jgi:hypothetical protein
VRFLFVLALALASAGSIEVAHLPPISPSYDAIAVFLPGGRLPQIPWEGFPDEARERFWALSCSGMLVQRTAWSAYLLVMPAGTSAEFLDAAGMLKTSYTLPDTSEWTRALSLSPADTTGARMVVWAESDSFAPPDALPLRASLWLAGGPDTLVISGPWDDNLFLWLPDSSVAGSSNGIWRGNGTELVPAGGRSFRVAVATTGPGTPAGLADYLSVDHPWDETFGGIWGDVFAATDSLVASLYPESTLCGGLVWLRGTGSSHSITPWEILPGPAAPARARFVIPWGQVPPPSPPSGRPPDVSGVHAIPLPCPEEGPDGLAVLACILERILARSALPGIPGARAILVMPGNGSLDVILIGDIEIADSSLRDTLRGLVSATALCPPESALVVNATLRASIREGRWLPILSPADVVMRLGQALGLTPVEGF